MGAAGSVDEFVERVGLGKELTTRKGSEWATDVVRVGEKWMNEVMEASTRVNVSFTPGCVERR